MHQPACPTHICKALRILVLAAPDALLNLTEGHGVRDACIIVLGNLWERLPYRPEEDVLHRQAKHGLHLLAGCIHPVEDIQALGQEGERAWGLLLQLVCMRVMLLQLVCCCSEGWQIPRCQGPLAFDSPLDLQEGSRKQAQTVMINTATGEGRVGPHQGVLTVLATSVRHADSTS
jgi:hypothetical protein